jgi:nucleolar protein 56
VQEIPTRLSPIQDAATDLSKFGKVVKMKAFVAFRNLQDALENINAVSEGMFVPVVYDPSPVLL